MVVWTGRAAIAEIREVGVSISLDDFACVSSLCGCANCPDKGISIARSSRIDTCPRSRVVRSIIDSPGIQARFVADASRHAIAFPAGIGVDHAQGSCLHIRARRCVNAVRLNALVSNVACASLSGSCHRASRLQAAQS